MVSKISKPLFWCALILLSELLAVFLLTGSWAFSHERKALICTTGLLFLLFSLFTPPRKNLLTIGIPLLFAFSTIYIKLASGEDLSPKEMLQYIGYVAAIYSLLLSVGLFIPKLYLRRLYFLLLFLLLLLPFGGLWFYYGISGSFIHADTLMAILQTNSSESQSYLKDYLTGRSLLACLVAILLFLGFAMNIKDFPRKSISSLRSKKSVAFLLVFLIFAGYLLHHGRKNPLALLYLDTQKYVQEYEHFAARKEKRDVGLQALSEIPRSNEKGVYLLVVGESQNKLHMNAYGYPRPTTPWLSKMRNNTNFLFFDKAYSCHTHTVPVLSYALTAKNQYNDMPLENAISLLEVAKAAGYKTVWLSNQVRYGAYDTPTTVIASEADEQIWLNHHVGKTTDTDSYDGKLVDKLKEIKYSDRMLIVIHLMGCHGSYEDRYPATRQVFRNGMKRIDAYDNAVLYNDYVMSRIYETAESIPHFQAMMFFSDHTDAVDQNLGHDSSNFVWPMTYIPFYIATSEEYRTTHQETVANLARHKDTVFTNDLVFNTVMGLMDVKDYPQYEPQNDFAKETYDDNTARFRTLFGKKKITDDTVSNQ